MAGGIEIKGVSQTITTLEGYAKDLGLDLLGELKRMGRSMAVECARMTQVWGINKSSQTKGEGAVAKDILRVYAGPSNFFLMIRKRDPQAAGIFWDAYKASDREKMRETMERAGVASRIGDKPDPGLHQAARTAKRKRVKLYRPEQLVLRKEEIQRYIARQQKRVGFVKAGWAKAADDLGGHRGIPAWASSKQPEATGRAIVDENPVHPKVTIENTIPYVMENLTSLEINGALHDAYGKILKYLQYRRRQPLKK